MSQRITGSSRPRFVNCPLCGTAVPWDTPSPFRPFCSERCKMIDLGAWATEAYRIPVAEDRDTPDDEDSGYPRMPN
jgi:uncharacterized protein